MITAFASALAALAMMQQFHPDAPLTTPPAVEKPGLPVAPPKPANPVVANDPRTGQPVAKKGLGPSDYGYVMPAGVTAKSVVYYSDGVACYAKIFYPKGFDAASKPGLPAVVMGQGWAGTHVSIEKYAARFAERGLVAMAIDYRGWGNSDGYARVISPVALAGGMERDENRHKIVENATVWIKRTRLLPKDQQEDYRNAISFIQGEAGVDPERIGIWGSSFAGGNSLAVAGQDARVKAIAIQIPGIGGNPAGTPPTALTAPQLKDAITRARTGQGEEMWTGYSRSLLIDSEMQAANRENNTMQWAKNIGERPMMVVVAQFDELINNDNAGKAALAFAKGPKEYIVVPDITHFEMYAGKPFEVSSEAAARWFVTHLAAK
ncbi:MAG: CocE/NonD family hydrolase [Alphaproteobacteria bacterium]|nr:CocE/NonD family hydrolase [Alphaproteobacteria bacterium]